MMAENIFSEAVLKTLNSFFSEGRRPHAVLIDGGSQEERDSLAALTAKMIVCENQSITPCGGCEGCRKATDGVHPDIIPIQKPDDKKKFVKEDVKRMVGEAHLTPNEAETKVYIIKDIHLMTEESQNLLLKILEEPPVYTSFVITSQSANAVISTVLSRVVRLRLGKASQEKFSEKAIKVSESLVEAMLSAYELDKIIAAAPLDGNKALTSEVLSMLCLVLRDAVSLKNGMKELLLPDFSGSVKLSQSLSLGKLLELYDKVSDLLRSLENNPNYTLLSAVLCASL